MKLIDEKIKEAMFAKNQNALEALRGLKTAVTNKEKTLGNRELTESEFLSVLSTTIKQRTDSIDMFTQAGRSDLVQKEQDQLNTILVFQPKQLTDEVLLEKVKLIMGENKNVGMLVGLFNKTYPDLKGQFDNNNLKALITSLC